MIETLKELFLDLDNTLGVIVTNLGFWTYLLLFCIIFLETGVLIFAFLPGDTLLLAVGVVAANPDVSFNIVLVDLLLIIAAVTGNMLNFYIGRNYGRGIIQSGRVPFVSPRNIERAEAFYHRHGALAIIFSRFFPYIRSFVPFFAGVADMEWKRYMLYNVIGALLWIIPLTLMGYFFGNLPVVKENFVYVIMFLAVFPFLPMIVSRYKKLRESLSKSSDEQ